MMTFGNIDVSNQTIEELFFDRIRDLTKRSARREKRWFR
jgi:hypothetical protein